ncbi:hypothetical protein MPH_08242 [Macrophomina phaseolina MS6]|uniref:Uncharacterized protein n=1 Tax=Macrophomina phaseolina (strain MS6) TaxID=1126212 RepID=K2RP89_MACPH|nr:hypothetical protein MPH_08242 [Macrophomina phaseolina MS6]
MSKLIYQILDQQIDVNKGLSSAHNEYVTSQKCEAIVSGSLTLGLQRWGGSPEYEDLKNLDTWWRVRIMCRLLETRDIENLGLAETESSKSDHLKCIREG